MASSDRRRNDPLRSRKATAIGGLAGAIVFWRTYSIESATRVTDWVQKVIETAIAFGKAAAELFGISAWLDAGVTWLYRSELVTTWGLPFAAGLVVAYATRTLLLTDKFLGYPFIDRLWPCLPDILEPRFERDGLPRYSAFAAGQPFLERDEDMNYLRRFAGDAEGPLVKFMYVKGKEGVGKTRLGLEWLKRMKAFGWDVGILDPGTKPLDVRLSRFRRNTAILIDEPGSLPEFWQVLDEFLRHNTKIRIILASQVSLRAPVSLDVEVGSRIASAEAPPLRLGGLKKETLIALAPDASTERLVDAGGCPLMVLLKPDDLKEVLRRVGLREENAKARFLYRVLALAALAGPISRVGLDAVVGQAIATSSLEPLFEDADRSTLDAVLPAFRPDIFADQVVLDYAFDHPGDRQSLFEKAVGLNVGACEHRLASLWRRGSLTADESHMRESLQKLFDEKVPDRRQNLVTRAIELVHLTAAVPTTDAKGRADLGPLTQALDELVEIVAMRPFDSDLRLYEAMGAVNAIAHYGTAGDVASLERWGARLIALAEHPSLVADREIRLEEAEGAINAIHYYGKAGDFASLERWGARLIALAEHPAFVADQEIRLREAQGAVNATNGYGAAGDFASLERWGARLIALAEHPAFVADQEIRLHEAKGAVNAIGDYGAAGDVASLERWGARLIALAEHPAFIADREIRLQEAKGAANAIRCYGAAGDFASLERWSARLIALAEHPAFVADREICLAVAKGADNAITPYGTAGDFASLERWGARLIALAENPAFVADQEIRLGEAMGAVNAINGYGTAGDFASLERWGARLIALAEHPAFVADREIRLEEAKGAVNAIIGYGRAGSDFEPRRQFWWRRLARVARDFPGHAEIQEIANDFGLTYSAQASKGWPYGAPKGLGQVHKS